MGSVGGEQRGPVIDVIDERPAPARMIWCCSVCGEFAATRLRLRHGLAWN